MQFKQFLKKLKAFFRSDKTCFCSAVIVAAGNSTRMGKDKVFLELNGVPVIVRTVRAFDTVDEVKEIILVTKQENLETLANLVKEYDLTKVKQVVMGGATRQISCLAGVSATSKEADVIAIHDSARPFVSAELIRACIKDALTFHGAVPGIKCVDTMKSVDDQGFISGSIDRDSTVRIQTPQVFDADLIKGALTFCVKNNTPVTDDSSAMAILGFRSKIVNGDTDNIKLTTPEDMVMAETILRKRGEIA